ncbi:MAG: rhodanese-like domain-containing protein [Gammaproteobacteria bacterium]|nr:rhodanese-like domain-containing protein [Gammaproteobacteria bacterium]
MVDWCRSKVKATVMPSPGGRLQAVLALVLLLLIAGSAAEDQVKIGESTDFVPLYKGKPYLHVIHEGRSVKVQRVQDPDYELKGYFAKTARKCPPFCIQPVVPAPGVAAIGEIELFDFMETKLRDGSGILIDARTQSWFRKGTIPGSVNFPFTLFGKGADDPIVIDALQAFGATERGEVGAVEGLLEEWGLKERGDKTERWDFSAAKELVFWCNGPACGQSPRAIRALVDLGYPKRKIKYYRGGMQMWQLWGLTTVVPRQ